MKNLAKWKKLEILFSNNNDSSIDYEIVEDCEDFKESKE
jgi:hypothetical protein